jgi:hypothetical protein
MLGAINNLSFMQIDNLLGPFLVVGQLCNGCGYIRLDAIEAILLVASPVTFPSESVDDCPSLIYSNQFDFQKGKGEGRIKHSVFSRTIIESTIAPLPRLLNKMNTIPFRCVVGQLDSYTEPD